VTRTARYSALLLTLPILMLAAPANAQIQASERGVVGQTIDGTTITIDYSRPQARGRDVFGGIVPWNVVWTPGANWATTLETTSAIKLNGIDVPAGTYSVWAIPRQDRWLMMLNPDPRIMHFWKPDSSQATVHIPATPEQTQHTEMLTWAFSGVRGDFATLSMQWATTAVPMRVEVPATNPVLSEAEMELYVGTYEMTVVPADPTWPESSTLEVFVEDGKLRGRMGFTIHPVDDDVFDMIQTGDGRFNPGLYHDGEFFNVEIGVGFDFTDDGERATGFQFVSADGTSFGEGKRAG
jgi:hypothetical protein